MIESSTALLKEIEETGSLSSSHCRRQNNIQCRKYVTELKTRFNTMQGWFMRCSWMEKMKILTEMFRSLRSLNSLSRILNLLMTIYGSSYTYASLEASLNFVYDKSLNDHNRAMHLSTLKKVQNADLEWFANLSDESEQIMILIGLLRLGGGSVLYHMYKRGVDLYQQLLAKLQTREMRFPTKHRRSRSFSEWPQIDVIINTLNINNSFTEEVEKHTQIWNDAMKQYRSDVKSPPKKKKTKQKKTKKKDRGKQKEEGLDWIQLCPIMIVKKIFSYLDAKTLNKIKSVNKYWSGAVKDFQTDLKSRKVFSKFIVKLQKGTPTAANFEIQKRPAKPTTKKRLKRLWERGAVSPKLISSFQKSLVELPLWTNSQELDKYILDIKQLKPFPRSCPVTQLPYVSSEKNARNIKDRALLFNPDPSIDSLTTALLPT